MSTPASLQKAVEMTMAAGYQIDREAFDFLTAVAKLDDPSALITKTLQKIESLQEKPMFIGKSLLEAVLVDAEPQEQDRRIETQTEPAFELPMEPLQFPAASGPYRPYAKDVESEVEVLEDPTGKLSSNGTLEEFLSYFQDRFKRMERLLRQRIDLKAATPIREALKSPAKTKLKIIGMVTEKREAKQQLLITLEDLDSSATVLVPTKAPDEVQKKAPL